MEENHWVGRPGADWARITADPAWKDRLEKQPQVSTVYIAINTTAPPFDNLQVRQALYRNPALAAVQAPFITEYLSGQTIRQHLVTDALARQIAAPTLVYWGDKNRTPPALGQHIANTVQHGQFHCAADCGHWAQFESAPEHNRVVAEFLARPDHPAPPTPEPRTAP